METTTSCVSYLTQQLANKHISMWLRNRQRVERVETKYKIPYWSAQLPTDATQLQCLHYSG